MSAHDIQLTDMVKTANVPGKAPSLPVSAPVSNPVSTTAKPKDGFYRSRAKRVLDVTLVLLSAPVVAPLIGFLALCVALGGGKPFYSQQRLGRNGKIYRIWKLRTMVPDADAVLEEHLAGDPALRAEWNSKQKLLDDPRITKVGSVLRKCSLDELPQLWNVLRGEMSLVGPRPMMVNQRDMYPGTAYYKLRPGITGMWQISDRNDTTFAARAKYDAAYHSSLSLKTDVKILLGTVRVVLNGTGH
jgi:lipopolysaccharide/colanic/teichoic acid biosynthesis glycosyltransferase